MSDTCTFRTVRPALREMVVITVAVVEYFIYHYWKINDRHQTTRCTATDYYFTQLWYFIAMTIVGELIYVTFLPFVI